MRMSKMSKWSITLGGLLGTLWVLGTAIYAGQAALSNIERLTAEAEGLWLQGRSEQALQKFEQALTQIREIGERGREWKILDRMGRIYLEQDQFQPALEHFQQGLNVALDLGDGSAQAVQLAAIAETYNMLQQPLQAITIYESLLAL
jgi:tetratricopeptide (TPR) repeat protein